MYDSVEELLRKIRLGEDTTFEMKEIVLGPSRVLGPGRDDFADEMAAMANTADGILLLGVNDKTKDIRGIPVERLDDVESFVREIANDSIRPPLMLKTCRMELPDATGTLRPILKVEIPRSLFVHKSPSGYYCRIGSSRRPMAPEYLARLFQQRSQTRLIRFDEQIAQSARINDLDSALWRRFAGPYQEDRAEDLLVKLGMARKDEDGVIRPTVSGILIAARDPRQWIPNAFVQAVAYRGATVLDDDAANYQLDAADLYGPLDHQVVDSCAFVRKNMRIGASKQLGRIDQPQYDMTAVFEAMVNAVAHRDYSIHGSKIRLRMFADRLEIYSPGTIPNTMTIESLPYRQSSRNETISSLLARCPIPDPGLAQHRSHMMDKRGEGVPIILERSAKLSGRTPEYRLLDNTELLLTIWTAKQDHIDT